MLKLLRRLKGKQILLLVLLILLVLAQVGFDLRLPAYMGTMITHLQDRSVVIETILKDGGLMLIFAVGSMVSNILVCLLAAKVAADVTQNVRREMFEKINSFSATEINKYSTSSLITRSTNDLTQIQTTFNQSFRFLIYAPLLSFGAIIRIIFTSWQLSIVVGIGIFILIAMLIVLFAIAIPKYNSIQVKTDRVNLIGRENLTGLRVIRAYNAENIEEEKFEYVNNDLTLTQRFVNRATGIIHPGMQFIMGILSLALVWVGAYVINITTGSNNPVIYSDLSVFTMYSTQILMGFMVVAVLLVILPRAIVCAKRVNEILDTKISIVEKEITKEGEEIGTVKFNNVTFAYPGSEKPVLSNISFEAKRGETVAFIGATGSGKTTIFNLLLRFYDVTSGEVLLDGVDVRDYKFDSIYSRIGYVPQKGMLFKGPLDYNVRYGKLDATDEEVKEALRISESTDFVSKLPGQEKYMISQGGKNVSGGQRQRLSIARAIITKPEILMFDDSFSALDYKTDKIVRANLNEKFKETTRLIVAQRIGTIMDADQIIVLDNGEMVGKGTHKELLKTCKTYQEIALSQLSKEELANG